MTNVHRSRRQIAQTKNQQKKKCTAKWKKMRNSVEFYNSQNYQSAIVDTLIQSNKRPEDEKWCDEVWKWIRISKEKDDQEVAEENRNEKRKSRKRKSVKIHFLSILVTNQIRKKRLISKCWTKIKIGFDVTEILVSQYVSAPSK